LLGKAATHASERDDAQREADALREQLEALQAARNKKSPRAGLTRNKRPRGRAPAGYGWDEQTGDWLDEQNGKPFELVDHPSRQRLRAEKRTAVLARCTVVWKAHRLLKEEEQRREPRQAVLQLERQAHLARLKAKQAEDEAEARAEAAAACVVNQGPR
jgi:hypothetical protein